MKKSFHQLRDNRTFPFGFILPACVKVLSGGESRTDAGEPSPIPTQLIQHDALNDYDQPRLNQLITEHESVSKCGEGLLPALVSVGSKAMSLYFAVHRSVIRSTSCTSQILRFSYTRFGGRPHVQE